ncbi:MAG: hypothetical protein AAF197_12535, partial [Pseudomonadota bacterium]
PFYSPSSLADFDVITGRGGFDENSEAVLRPAILALFREEYEDLVCVQDATNPGKLVVDAASLRSWIDTDAEGSSSGPPRRRPPDEEEVIVTTEPSVSLQHGWKIPRFRTH